MKSWASICCVCKYEAMGTKSVILVRVKPPTPDGGVYHMVEKENCSNTVVGNK